MKQINTIDNMRAATAIYKEKSIGFVPTMGYLHEGHLSLVQQCRQENDITVVSIFVNPTQFSPEEDLDEYPRDLERDEKLLQDLEVDVLFYPQVDEMYPKNFLTAVSVQEWGEILCGKSRPHHFQGVTTVVLKLFNIVTPVRAYFGQKDAQQAIIIKKMIKDLNLDIEMRVLPIIRDSDGLALSSRNNYLSQEEREAARLLPHSLNQAKEAIVQGIKDADTLKKMIVEGLNKSRLIQIDYVSLVSINDLQELDQITHTNTLVAAAIRVGKTRLIDNFILGEI